MPFAFGPPSRWYTIRRWFYRHKYLWLRPLCGLGFHWNWKVQWAGGFGEWDFPHTELICRSCHTHKPDSRKRA